MATRRSGRGGSAAGRYGAQEGLGNALAEIGTALFKSQMADKMEQEREDRAEERDARMKERQRILDTANTSEFRIERDADGATWRQGYNKFGTRTGDRELASAEDIKNYNYEDEKKKVSLDSLVAKAAADRAEAENLPRKYARDEELFDLRKRGEAADIEASNALAADRYAQAATRGKSSTSRTGLADDLAYVNDSDVANAMIDENRDLFKGYEIEEPEARRIAQEVIAVARTSGKDPVDILNKMLPAYVDRNRARKNTRPQASSSGGGLNLGN